MLDARATRPGQRRACRTRTTSNRPCELHRAHGVPAARREAARLRPGRSRTSSSTRPRRDLFFAINFNHRYAEPIRRAPQAINEGELGELVFATWRFGGEAEPRHPSAREPDRDPVPRPSTCSSTSAARSPRSSAQMAKPAATGLHDPRARARVRERRGRHACSAATTRRTPIRTPTCLEVNGTEGRALVNDTVKRLTLSRAGDETRGGLGGRLLQRRRPRVPPHLRPARRRAARTPCAPETRRRSTPAPVAAHSNSPAP